LYLAGALTPLWLATEAFLDEKNIAPPFWAFAWPGAEALARHVTRNPALVAGKTVLDFAAGCGLAAIACAKAGAVAAASEIDDLACAAIGMNAALNGVAVEILAEDVTAQACRWDVVLAGDVFYEAPMTRKILPWLRDCARTAVVIVGDPARAYTPSDGVEELARYEVPTLLELEDRESRVVRVLQLLRG
jgi:predicted nicotinamide N-methyase